MGQIIIVHCDECGHYISLDDLEDTPICEECASDFYLEEEA